MKLLSLAGLSLVLLTGCGGPPPPTLAGGKPVSHWVESLRTSPDIKLRKEAAFKLGNVGSADATAFPAVLGALKDADAVVRSEAILALVKFGPAALEAVPVLTELRDSDADPKVRTYATKALEKLRGDKS
jgi:HEAT repeat protein